MYIIYHRPPKNTEESGCYQNVTTSCTSTPGYNNVHLDSNSINIFNSRT